MQIPQKGDSMVLGVTELCSLCLENNIFLHNAIATGSTVKPLQFSKISSVPLNSRYC